MIDLHCHIIPFLDDGAQNARMACEMAKLSLRSGVDVIVATPHCNIDYMPNNLQGRNYWASLGLFRALLKQHHLPLTVLPGAELFAQRSNLQQLLEEQRIITINHSRYLLTEFSFHASVEEMDRRLHLIQRFGYIPVIAHPERYTEVQQSPGCALRWLREGYVLQVNKGSLLGRLGESARRTGSYLVQNGFAHVIASDAHHPYHRPTGFRSLIPVLDRLCPREYAKLLLQGNPQRIVSDKAIISPDL